MWKRTRRWVPAVLTAAAMLTAEFGCSSSGEDKKKTPGESEGKAAQHETPEAVFQAAQMAMNEKDFGGFCNCLTPDARDSFAGSMVMMAMMTKAFAGMAATEGEDAKKKADEALAGIDQVLAKHGLSEEQLKAMDESGGEQDPREAMKQLVTPIKDKGAFVGDMMAAFEALGEGGPGGPAEVFNGNLVGLKIDGDSATATIEGKKDGQDMSKPIAFKRVDNGWLIEMPTGRAGRPASRPPVGGEPPLGEPPLGDAPELDTPELDTPELDTPELDTPELDAPDLKAPDLKAPDLDAPSIDLPASESEEGDAEAKSDPVPK